MHKRSHLRIVELSASSDLRRVLGIFHEYLKARSTELKAWCTVIITHEVGDVVGNCRWSGWRFNRLDGSIISSILTIGKKKTYSVDIHLGGCILRIPDCFRAQLSRWLGIISRDIQYDRSLSRCKRECGGSWNGVWHWAARASIALERGRAVSDVGLHKDGLVISLSRNLFWTKDLWWISNAESGLVNSLPRRHWQTTRVEWWWWRKRQNLGQLKDETFLDGGWEAQRRDMI